MLVLDRKIGESIFIGGIIEVKVLRVQFNVVKLGISAPKEVTVHREEIHKKIINGKDTYASA